MRVSRPSVSWPPSSSDRIDGMRKLLPDRRGGVWFVVAALANTYRRPGWRSLLRNWIVAVPVGLLVRTLIVGSPSGGRLLVFLAVGLAFTLVLLVLGRLLARMGSRRRL